VSAVPSPVFLTLDEVLALHADQFRRYGGGPGLRDELVDLVLDVVEGRSTKADVAVFLKRRLR